MVALYAVVIGYETQKLLEVEEIKRHMRGGGAERECDEINLPSSGYRLQTPREEHSNVVKLNSEAVKCQN